MKFNIEKFIQLVNFHSLPLMVWLIALRHHKFEILLNISFIKVMFGSRKILRKEKKCKGK